MGESPGKAHFLAPTLSRAFSGPEQRKGLLGLQLSAPNKDRDHGGQGTAQTRQQRRLVTRSSALCRHCPPRLSHDSGSSPLDGALATAVLA